jgi:anthranilate 1,2-dioxygenase large subunit
VREPYGNAKMFTCIYHQWCYGQKGELKGVPFRRGLKGVGGMPADFEMQDHGLRRLRVATYRGIIFATFSDEVEPLEDYLGPMICKHLDEVLNRPLKVLGYQRQRVYANWKLYLENIRDAYHGSLLHEFLRVFGLSRLTQVAGGHMDERHRHSVLFQYAGSDNEEESRKAYNENLMERGMTSLTLRDPEMVRLVKEQDSGITTRVLSVFPNGVLHQIYNCLNLRQVRPKGPGEFELLWTVFGYADDDDEMIAHRAYQANMVGPAGLVAMEDAEALELVQRATLREAEACSLLEMAGGGAIADQETRLTEVPIRGFWSFYSELMGIEPKGAVR